MVLFDCVSPCFLFVKGINAVVYMRRVTYFARPLYVASNTHSTI
jgi:hypothetical protein